MYKINDIVYAKEYYEPMIPKGTPGIIMGWWFDFPEVEPYPVVDFSQALGPNYNRYEMKPYEIVKVRVEGKVKQELTETIRDKRIVALEKACELFVGHNDYPILLLMLNGLRNSD